MRRSFKESQSKKIKYLNETIIIIIPTYIIPSYSNYRTIETDRETKKEQSIYWSTIIPWEFSGACQLQSVRSRDPSAATARAPRRIITRRHTKMSRAAARPSHTTANKVTARKFMTPRRSEDLAPSSSVASRLATARVARYECAPNISPAFRSPNWRLTSDAIHGFSSPESYDTANVISRAPDTAACKLRSNREA